MKKFTFGIICALNKVIRLLNPILFDVNTRPTWFVDDYCSKTRNKWSSGPKNSLFWKAFSDGVTIFEEKKSSKWFSADSKKFLWWINLQKSLWRSRIQINFKKNKLSKNWFRFFSVKLLAIWLRLNTKSEQKQVGVVLCRTVSDLLQQQQFHLIGINIASNQKDENGMKFHLKQEQVVSFQKCKSCFASILRFFYTM